MILTNMHDVGIYCWPTVQTTDVCYMIARCNAFLFQCNCSVLVIIYGVHCTKQMQFNNSNKNKINKQKYM